jgi:DNA repair protein RadD
MKRRPLGFLKSLSSSNSCMGRLRGVDVAVSLADHPGRVNTGPIMLRDFQNEIDQASDRAWAEGAQNVMVVAPTGSGKTVLMGHKIQKLDVPACAIAHRQELVGQIALALNREEVPHGVVAPKNVIKEIIAAEMETHGRSFYNPRAAVRAASVDTLKSYDPTDHWVRQVRLVLPDEGHHVLRDNKWGRTMGALFPTALGLLFTAHALRADGAGLGRSADGVVDRLVLGPSGRNLINRGYLTDYRVICPPLPKDLKLDDIPVGDNGELNMQMTRERINASASIVGDVVRHYRKFAEGELGITFAVDVTAANKIADRFNSEGIPAAVITHKTPIAQRAHMMRQFRERQLIQLVNVDCLGEGTDVPACVVVSMARPTASFQLCAQQFGRMLRILVSDELNRIWHGLTDHQRLAYIAASAKPKGILIDHVGNVALGDGIGRHGLPDRPRTYSLERRSAGRRQPDDAIPLTTCLNPGYTAPLWENGPVTADACWQPYERVLLACPHCGFPRPPPQSRGSPLHVDGDLFELDPAVLAQLRGDIEEVNTAPLVSWDKGDVAVNSIAKRNRERLTAQTTLRDAIATWAGWQKHMGRPDGETLRRFFQAFSVDIASAQALGAREAVELEFRIRMNLSANNVVKQTCH